MFLSYEYYVLVLRGGVPPPKHALKFCQFVEAMPKGQNITITFGLYKILWK